MSEAIPKIPNLDLVQLEFLIANNLGDKSTLEKLLKGIKADSAPA